MSETRRTPGPWQARFIYRMIRRVRESPGDLLIASDPEDDRGDACLMAAAPGLLEALETMRAWAIPGMDWTDDIGREILAVVDTAIAKAKGVDA
jgi:hypothetical protein